MKASDQSGESLSNPPPFAGDLRAWGGFARASWSPLATLLGFMTLFRFLAWWMNDRAYAAAPPSDMIGVFATGARFDLLVLGFVLLPPAVLGPILAVMNRFTLRAMRVFRGYLALAWWAISISALTDLLYFLVHARRMSVFDWKGLDAGTLVSDAVVWEGWGTVIMGAVIVACAAALGARAVLSMAPSKSRGGPVSFGRGFVLALAPLLVAGLMARGTVTPHHLERAHAEVFSGPLLTELALNAVWCFDKEPVGP